MTGAFKSWACLREKHLLLFYWKFIMKLILILFFCFWSIAHNELLPYITRLTRNFWSNYKSLSPGLARKQLNLFEGNENSIKLYIDFHCFVLWYEVFMVRFLFCHDQSLCGKAISSYEQNPVLTSIDSEYCRQKCMELRKNKIWILHLNGTSTITWLSSSDLGSYSFW